jgi:hypothetical protein
MVKERQRRASLVGSALQGTPLRERVLRLASRLRASWREVPAHELLAALSRSTNCRDVLDSVNRPTSASGPKQTWRSIIHASTCE